MAELLHALDYSLQADPKTLEGSQHADRAEQFEYINRKAQRYLQQGKPVISVDTKTKEWVGDFKNAGQEWELSILACIVLRHSESDCYGVLSTYCSYVSKGLLRNDLKFRHSRDID